MSEAKMDKLDLPPEESIELDDVEFLKALGWSPITVVAKSRRPTRADKIAEIDRLPTAERIIASAYYALQLGDGSLTSVREATQRLEEIESPPGEARSKKDQKIIDGFLVATKVEDLLYSAYNRYREDAPVQEMSAKESTGERTPENTGCLDALKRMRTAHEPSRKVPESIARSSEIILRMVIADWVKNNPEAKPLEEQIVK